MIGDRDDDGNGGVGNDKLYKRRVEPILDFFFNSYLLLNSILGRS